MPSLGHPNSRVQSFLHTHNRFTFWEKPLKFHPSLPFTLSSSKSKTPGGIQSSPSSLDVAKLPASQTSDILLLVDKAHSLAPKFFDWSGSLDGKVSYPEGSSMPTFSTYSLTLPSEKVFLVLRLPGPTLCGHWRTHTIWKLLNFSIKAKTSFCWQRAV